VTAAVAARVFAFERPASDILRGAILRIDFLNAAFTDRAGGFFIP
jgi:hypothetical protein